MGRPRHVQPPPSRLPAWAAPKNLSNLSFLIPIATAIAYQHPVPLAIVAASGVVSTIYHVSEETVLHDTDYVCAYAVVGMNTALCVASGFADPLDWLGLVLIVLSLRLLWAPDELYFTHHAYWHVVSSVATALFIAHWHEALDPYAGRPARAVLDDVLPAALAEYTALLL